MSERPTLALMSPLLDPIGGVFAQHFNPVLRSAFSSDAAFAAAHPDVRVLVVIGGDKLDTRLIESLPNLG